MEAHVEDHSRLGELVPLLAHLEQLVGLVQFFGGQEGLQDDAALGVAAEGRVEVGARDVVYFFDDGCAGAEGELQFEFYYFPLVGAQFYFGVLLEKSFFSV